MPLPYNNVRYRWIKRGGKMIRLAFVGGKVVEVKEKDHEAKMVKRNGKKTA